MRHLKYLIAVARSGSFRKAAKHLHVQQSSVSRAIRKLEDQLGVSLFERRHTGVSLTNAGRQFLEEIEPALEQLDLARKSAAAAGRGEAGEIRIGVFAPLAGGFSRELIRNYAVHHPNIAIDIRDGTRAEHITAIRRGWLDIAFVTGFCDVLDCETVELWKEGVYVALAKEHALAGRRTLNWPDLRSERFIVSRFAPGPEVYDYTVRRATAHNFRPEITHKATTQETLMNLVGLGQGLTLVSAAWVAVKLPNLVLRPLAHPEDIVPFSAVWSAQNDNPALRRFISVAHVLAGRVRRGSSDWSPDALGVAPIGARGTHKRRSTTA